MNHAQLRSFHAVAELGGFSAAARQIGISQPALTVQVQTLERDFGVQLFHRIKRGVRLTDTGKTLLSLTQRYFSIESEAAEFLKSVGAFRSGQIRIAADGPYHVIPLLTTIRKQLPEMDVNVSFGNSDDVLTALKTYDAHLGLSSSPTFDDQYIELNRSQQAIVLMVPAQHSWSKLKTVSLKQLHEVPLVMREQGSSTRKLFEDALLEVGIKPRIVLELGSREAVREAVAADLGLGVVQAREFGNDSRLAAVAFNQSSPQAEERLICLKERAQTPLLRELTRLINAQD